MAEQIAEIGEPVCCQSFGKIASGVMLFDRMLALGYYDGATEAVVRCFACGQEFLATCIDWDDDQELRVFQFSLLALGTLDRLLEVMSGHGEPTWPHWLPKLEALDLEEVSQAVDECLRANLREPVFLMVTTGCLDRYYAYSRCDASVPREPSIEEGSWPPGCWLERLGFSRNGQGGS